MLNFISFILTLNKTGIKKINSFEMWSYQRMLKSVGNRKNENVWIINNNKRESLSLVDKIGNAKFKYFIHILRNKLLSQIVMGKIPGSKAQGRQRKHWMDNNQHWINNTGQT